MLSTNEIDSLFILHGPKVSDLINRCRTISKKILKESFRIRIRGITEKGNDLIVLGMILSFEIFHSKTKLGYFKAYSSFPKIGINIQALYWSDERLIQILTHELCHFMTDLKYPSSKGQAPHGHSFQKIIELYKIPSSIAAPTTANEDLTNNSYQDDKYERMVSKLLALSKSDNKNEASLALAKLQQVLSKRSASYSSSLSNSPLTYELRLDVFSSKQTYRWQKYIALIITEVLHVNACVAKQYYNSHPVLYIIGPKTKMKRAEFLTKQIIDFCETEYKASKRLNKHLDKNSFYLGIYNELSHIKEQKADKPLNTFEQALIALDEEERSFHSNQAGWRSSSSSRLIRIDATSFELGADAAARMQLKEGLDSETPQSLLVS